MIRTENGKSVNIPDKEIESYMRSLDLTKEQAIEMWLDDEGYTDNEEQLELEKKDLFDLIHDTLKDYETDFNGKTTVLKENKLIQFEINVKFFKIDLIEQRNKKK